MSATVHHVERARRTDRRRNRSARHQTEAGGRRTNPCPVCGDRDRFGVNIRKQVFNCKGAVGGDVITLVQHLDGCQFRDAITKLAGDSPRKPTPPAKPEKADSYNDEQRNLDRAETIWRETSALGLDAIAYFARRRIDINQVPEHGGLRFHVRCPWPDGTKKTALGNEPRGIWRRPINGEKPTTLGPMAGCVIRLWPDEAVEHGLVIGEGVETVLSMATRRTHRGTLLQPAWTVCVANNLERFPILPGIDALTVLVDNDVNGRGQKAAARCAERWSAAGREVTRLTPKVLGADFNDVVMS